MIIEVDGTWENDLEILLRRVERISNLWRNPLGDLTIHLSHLVVRMIPILVHLEFDLLMEYPSLWTHSNSWVLLIFFIRVSLVTSFFTMGTSSKATNLLMNFDKQLNTMKQSILSSPWIVEKKQLFVVSPCPFRLTQSIIYIHNYGYVPCIIV